MSVPTIPSEKESVLNAIWIGGLIACFVLAQAQAGSNNRLVAHYLVDGKALDGSGNGGSLTNNGAVPDTDRFGQAGFAFAFDGKSSIMVETNNSDSLVLHDSFTLSCWAKFPSLSSTNYSLVRKDGDANLIIVNRQCYVETFLDGEEIRAFSGSPPVRAWCMITATWDGTNFVQYLNGQQQPSAQDKFGRFVPSAPITLGGSLIYSDRLHGSLDDVRIYTRPLSASEVQQLYLLESRPLVSIQRINVVSGSPLTFVRVLRPSFSNLHVGTNYVLQISGDMSRWTEQDNPFTATDASMALPA